MYINTILPTSFRSLRWPLSFKILHWPQIYSFLSHLCHVSSSIISLSACYCLASSIPVNHDAHYTVIPSLRLRLYSSIQIFSSSVYSLSPPPIFFLQCETQSFTPVQKLETKYTIQKQLDYWNTYVCLRLIFPVTSKIYRDNILFWESDEAVLEGRWFPKVDSVQWYS